MRAKIEGWLFNVYGGKLVARGVTLASAWAFSYLLPKLSALAGVAIPFSQDQLTGALMAASMWLFEEIKKRRMANPTSPAVQTDPALIAPPAEVKPA